MEKERILQIVKELREKSKKRNFKQTYDLIVTLKDVDIKKAENKIDFFHTLPYGRGKKLKICAFVGPELLEQAKNVCDKVVFADEFEKYSREPKSIKALARDYDFFIAQANIMPKIASVFGKVLGPKGKMPNPKAECVVPANANLKPLYEKLQKTIRIITKDIPMIQCVVGSEALDDERVVANILSVYEALVHHLHNGEANIKEALLKLTMSKPMRFV